MEALIHINIRQQDCRNFKILVVSIFTLFRFKNRQKLSIWVT